MLNFGLPEQDATLEELIDHVAKLQKQIEFMMSGNLNSKNIREVGDFVVGQNSFASRDGKVGISSLVVGQENVRFWAGAENMYAAPFRVYDTGRLVATNAEISGSITMGPGSEINWGDVNAPSYGQITGSKPPTNADNTNLALPSSLGINYTKIGSTYIYTGTLSADQINAGTLSANHVRGGVISGVNIDVDTDLRVGNNVYMGVMSDTADKTINMKSLVKISAIADGLDISALAGIELRTLGEVQYNGQEVATKNWVESSAQLTARFG